MRETRNYCAARWNKKISEKFELRVRDRTRIEEHATGKSTCWLDGRKNVCQQKMHRVCVDYQEIVVQDVNRFERNSEIQYCSSKNAWRIMATKIAKQNSPNATLVANRLDDSTASPQLSRNIRGDHAVYDV